MPKGSKKRKAEKKKKEAAAAAAIEKTNNEAPHIAIPKENSPVMEYEGIARAFVKSHDEPNVVLPKRTALLENLIATNVPDFEGKETAEGIQENPMPAVMHSGVQSLTVAEPSDIIPADETDVVVNSAVVSAPYVLELDSQDIDAGSTIRAPPGYTDFSDFKDNEANSVPPKPCEFNIHDFFDFVGKVANGSKENPVSNESYSSAAVSEPQDPKMNGAQKKKKEAAAAHENTNNEEPHIAISEETSLADETDVVVESYVVSSPRVLKLDSQDKDGYVDFSEYKNNVVIQVTSEPCELNVTDVCDFEAQGTRGTKENPVPTEIFSSDSALEPKATSPAAVDETNAAAILELHDNAGGSTVASDDAAFSVLKDKEVISTTTESRDLDAAEDKRTLANDENAGFAVENQETAALNEFDALEKTEDPDVCDFVGKEAYGTKENPVSAEIYSNVPVLEPQEDQLTFSNDENVVEKSQDLVRLGAENKEIDVQTEVDTQKNTEEAVQPEVNDIEKNNFEDAPIVENQVIVAPIEVDAVENTEDVVHLVDMVDAISKDVKDIETNIFGNGIATKPEEAVIVAPIEVDDLVNTEEVVVMIPEVGKQLKEIKEMVEDVLNRLIAMEALLHKN